MGHPERRAGREPITGHGYTVQDIAFQPRGKLLATAGWDNTVRLWDLDAHAAAGPPLAQHTNRPVRLSFSPDGTRLASAGWDGTPLVWDVATGTVHTALREPGDSQSVRFVDGGRLVGSGGGVIAGWDLDTAGGAGGRVRTREPATHPGRVAPVRPGRRVHRAVRLSGSRPSVTPAA